MLLQTLDIPGLYLVATPRTDLIDEQQAVRSVVREVPQDEGLRPDQLSSDNDG